ncbi:hypothetical protein [Paenibacillus larvae]|uniref:Uncharacterized protein n=1 Tax=Paenibacillus larvae subsp. larvae TaxID=147375 RepID=A0A2L1U428_9BACL|nr:hypothetical protein [Paenibacillus larvae]AVF27695.1 hypothetical protein ERICIII_03585 [Paenibacillus larvae subsp. larvae]MCY7521289.1 hypothetical protein [Paenibacillus larvae]MCY9502863.1 hypothetical protein [Paenibacillus larvae]MCY9679812.1 hypothetical protein [Paenibacillus larvae]MCY9745730.1 hypothetical protein [Paenibacillus larvae]
MTVVRDICMLFFGLSSMYEFYVSHTRYQANDISGAIYHILLALFWLVWLLIQAVLGK